MHINLIFTEAQLKSDLEEAKAYIRSGKDPQKSFELVASATRIAKRVTALTDAEIDNSDDPQLKRDLTTAKDTLQQSMYMYMYTHTHIHI